jgi:hypothetical protein
MRFTERSNLKTASFKGVNNMVLNNKVYDILKWVVVIVIPAITTAYVGLAAIWGFPYATEIAKTSAVVCTLLGALLGISTAQYNKGVTAE